MAKKLYPETDIQNIANAIRALNGSSDTYTVGQMASAIVLPENAYYLKESASANPLSITDGEELKCQSTVVTFTPKQDLHGQSAPYPASGGKNKLPLTVSGIKSLNSRGEWNGNIYTRNGVTYELLTNSVNEVTGIKVNGTADGNSNLTLSIDTSCLSANTEYKINGAPEGARNSTYRWQVNINDNTLAIAIEGSDLSATTPATINKFDSYIVVLNGAQITNKIFYPMVRLSTVTDSTFAPYSNICPISGWDSLSLNKCNEEYAQLWTIDTNFDGNVNFNQLIQNGNFADTSEWLLNNSTVSASGNVLSFTGSSSNASMYQPFPLVGGHKYLKIGNFKLSGTPNKNVWFRASKGNGTYDDTYLDKTNTNWQTISSIFECSVSGNLSIMLRDNSTSDWVTILCKNFMLFDLTAMFGSTIADYIYSLEQATVGSGVAFFRSMYTNDYYPYNTGTSEIVGTNIATATFDSTVYGGSYDFVSGKLVIDRALYALNGTEKFIGTTGNRVYFSNILDIYIPEVPNTVELYCSHFKCASQSTYASGTVYKSTTNVAVVFCDNTLCTDITTFKDYVIAQYNANTPVVIAYKLATPTEITLTPEDIELLKGANTVWTDGDTVQLEYWSKSNTTPLLNMLSMNTINISNINNENNENEVEEIPIEESEESLEEIENIDNSENE